MRSVTFLITAVLNLCAVSYDRLTAIVLPRESRFTMRGAKIIMILTWLTGFTLGLPLAIYRNYRVRRILQLLPAKNHVDEISSLSEDYDFSFRSLFLWVFVAVGGCCCSSSSSRNGLTSGTQMEEFCGNILQGKCNIFTNLLACDSIGDGTFAINRNDNLLFGHFLEGINRFPLAYSTHTGCCGKRANSHYSNQVIDYFFFPPPVGSLRTESAEARKFNFDFIQNKSGTNALHRCEHIHCITYPIHCADFHTKSIAKEPGNGPNRRMVLYIVVHITLFALLECSRQSGYLWYDKW